MLRLLESGKDVVTANKALLAEHGPELFDRARELGRSIAFEASVAGGIPIIANISQCLSANQIESLDGILNGTTQFILTQDARGGRRLRRRARRGPAAGLRRGRSDAGRRRQRRGPEAGDPRPPGVRRPRRIGKTFRAWASTQLDVSDVRYAKEMGYRIKLLAVAELDGDTLELHVSPTLVKRGQPLAEVSGPFNAIRVVGDAVGPLFFHGQGAGQMPTASAVVADMIDTAVGRTAITFRTLELWSNRKARVTPREHAKADGRVLLARRTSKTTPACWRKSPACSASTTFRSPRVLQQEVAEGRRHRAAGDHDARNDRRGHAQGVRGDQQAGVRARQDGADVGEGLDRLRSVADYVAVRNAEIRTRP